MCATWHLISMLTNTQAVPKSPPVLKRIQSDSNQCLVTDVTQVLPEPPLGTLPAPFVAPHGHSTTVSVVNS